MNKDTLKNSGTNWEKLRDMKDEDIDYSDIPPITDEMWKKGFVKNRQSKQNDSESVIVEKEIIEFFKNQEGDYRENINRLLREYVETHQVEKV